LKIARKRGSRKFLAEPPYQFRSDSGAFAGFEKRHAVPRLSCRFCNFGFFIVDANPNAHFVSDDDTAGAQQGIFVSFKKRTLSKKFSLAICAICNQAIC
jgi:hypothetical protein